MTTPNHKWRFFRAGGVDQVRIDSGADITHLDQLDQKLWVVLSCPVAGSEFDEKTLAILDSDKDGFVRVPEIKAASKWLATVLKNSDGVTKSVDGVPLASIADGSPEGHAILASAKRILANLGKAEATVITVTDAMETGKIFSLTPFNGDGVVPAELIEDAGVKKVANDILATVGPVADRCGKPGYDTAKLDEFFKELQAFSDWSAGAEKDGAVLAFGKQTPEVAAALAAVRVKIDDYFGRCRLAAFDSRAAAALNFEEKAYLEVAAKDLQITADEVKHFPLALVEAGKPLPLKDGANPAWAEAISKFAKLAGLEGKPTLAEADWLALKAKVAPYEAWSSSKAGAKVEKLGLEWVRQILDSGAKDALADLIAKDKAVEAEMNAIASVEKLARLHRDFHQLVCNFVCFADFYSQRRPGIFQVGTLYLDSRATDLCMAVNDAGRHSTFAIKAGAFLVYCDCTRPGGEKMTIAAAVTDGDSDELFVGRNCIFYDRKGRDWNAQISKIVDQPISIRQAFLSPYKKFVRMIEELIAKRAAAAEADSDKLVASAADTTANVDKKVAEAAAQPEPKKFDIGLITGIGVALGSMAAAFSGLMGTFFGPGKNVLIGVLSLIGIFVVIISGPSMLLAYMKLRKRNLGPLLDANGWAINVPVKINVPFGAALTHLAKLPAGAERSTEDPYAEAASPWPGRIKKLVILAALLWVAWYVIMTFFENSEAAKFLNKALGKKEAAVSAEVKAPVPAPTAVEAGKK